MRARHTTRRLRYDACGKRSPCRLNLFKEDGAAVEATHAGQVLPGPTAVAIARRSAPRLHAARRRSHARQHSRPAEVRRSLTCSCAAMAASATRNTAETPSRQRKRPASLVRLSLSSLIRQSRAVSVWRAAVLSTLSHHRCQHRSSACACASLSNRRSLERCLAQECSRRIALLIARRSQARRPSTLHGSDRWRCRASETPHRQRSIPA